MPVTWLGFSRYLNQRSAIHHHQCIWWMRETLVGPLQSPQPAVTYTPPPMHTVGAGDVSWSFAIPEPTITYTPPTMDLVDAGDVDWSSSVTEPTITYTPPPLDHTVNAGDVAWTFHVSQPTVTHIPLVPIEPSD